MTGFAVEDPVIDPRSRRAAFAGPSRARLRRAPATAALLAGPLAGLLLLAAPGVASEPPRAEGEAREADTPWFPHERPGDPPGKPALAEPGAKAALNVTFGRFTSVQVNVSPTGANIVGDAANEPTIAVDPTNPARKAIGWRQFDTIASDFRQAGLAFTTDGGATWIKSTLDPGVFRSDPVLAFNSAGVFFYSSLLGTFRTQVFASTDGGATWGPPTFSFGGDKQWLVVDRFSGDPAEFHHQTWSTASNPTPTRTYNRSIDGGGGYQEPTAIPGSPIWGTVAVANDGTVYVVGTNGPGGPIVVSRSTTASYSSSAPTFTTTTVDLGGTVQLGGPNPVGLLGQLWIGVDHSTGPREGWVYVLATVRTPGDPMDVMFIRSTDRGRTWSRPVRVNDDPVGNGAWQWFGTMSVAPDGHIDAAWVDARASGDSTLVTLHYAYSVDGGVTWSGNEQASPMWNSRRGWPRNDKIGDYYHMVSDLTGADLAWAATFGGEQNVYYLRIPRVYSRASTDPATGFGLRAAIPDPFITSTTIGFEMPPGGGHATLEVFDINGRRVAVLIDGEVSGGLHATRWTGDTDGGHNVGPGVYVCRFRGAGREATRKLVKLQ